MKNRGDTMVEVMICLSVAGLIFMSAYGAARRSTIGIRNAQERIEALKLAETQIEFIRANNTNTAGLFCFSQDGSSTTTGFTGNAGNTSLALDTLAGYPANCNQNSLYYVSVNGSSTGPPRQYDVMVRWFSLSGGKNQVMLSYIHAQ